MNNGFSTIIHERVRNYSQARFKLWHGQSEGKSCEDYGQNRKPGRKKNGMWKFPEVENHFVCSSN